MTVKHYTFSSRDEYSEERIPLSREEIESGDVVAFDAGYGPGVAIMESGDWFHIAYNFYPKHENLTWVQDSMPEDIQLYAPTPEDMRMAIEHLYTTDEYSVFGNQLGASALRGMDAYLRRAIARVDDLFREREKLQEQIISRYLNVHEEEREALKRRIEEGENTIEKLRQKMAILEDDLLQQKEIIMKLEEDNARLREVPTEDDFVKRLLQATKKQFKHDRAKADGIRQVLDKMGRNDAEADLDAWIEGRKSPTTIQAKEYVQTMIVETQIENVESGGTGVVKESK